MQFSRLCRYLLIPSIITILFTSVTVATHALEVGDRVLGSELASA